MQRHFLALVLAAAALSPAAAQTIYPIDRADISPAPASISRSSFPVWSIRKAKLTIDGKDHAEVLGRAAISSPARTTRTCPR